MKKKSARPAKTRDAITVLATLSPPRRNLAERYITELAAVEKDGGAPPPDLSLTVDERDSIHNAKERGKAMLTLVTATLNEVLINVNEDADQTDEVLINVNEDADQTDAVLTACDIMREAFNAIDETFHAAGERHEAAMAAGGTR